MSEALGKALMAALAETSDGGAAVIFARDAADLPLLRAATADHALVLMVLVPTVPNLNKSMLIAAVGGLAVECAPHARIVALDVGVGAEVEDVVAAGVFLASADSTTGQILCITQR